MGSEMHRGPENCVEREVGRGSTPRLFARQIGGCDVVEIEFEGPSIHIGRGADLTILNNKGSEVRRFAPAITDVGNHLVWDRCDKRGNRSAAGVYFARLVCDAIRMTTHFNVS